MRLSWLKHEYVFLPVMALNEILHFVFASGLWVYFVFQAVLHVLEVKITQV